MRINPLVLPALLVALPTALADESNLAGGALITHHVPEIAYSTDPPPCGDWCCAYEGHEITDPSQENVRIDGPGGAVWYVLAAWSESKEWCGVEYGFGAFDVSILAFDDHGPCFPVDGLELPTSGWPGPNEGVAITVVGGDTWTGNWVPVYYFVAYAYSEAGQIPIDVDPVGPFIGFANCQNPPGIFPLPENTPTEFRRGAMGINTEGIRAAPGASPPMGVCCVDVWCYLLPTQAECDDLGGVWYPEWESCDPNPCNPEAVCCYGPTHLQCVVVPESQCTALPSGVWHPEWISCDPNPCAFTPARSTSWGEIKILYR